MNRNNSGLIPTADKILVEPLKIEEKTSGGIVLATGSLQREKMAQIVGTVIAMGTTAKECPEMEGIEVGDIVLYARYCGVELPVDGITYTIMRARDVIGKTTRSPDSVLRGAQSSAEVFGHNQIAA